MSINLLADIFRTRKSLAIPEEIAQKFSDESLCRKCGQCCYSSVLYQDRLTIIPDLPCKYLKKQNENMAICSIYSERQKVARWCNNVTKDTVCKGLFPDDCPYVQNIPGYQGKVMISGQEKERFYLWLSRTFPDQIRPEYISELDWGKFILMLNNLGKAQAERARKRK